MADYIYSMETRLTPDQQGGVNLVQEIARRAGLNLYLTGGTIRDLITGFPIRDIDLSIQGNPLNLQKELEKPGISVQGIDEDLRTLQLLMPGNVRAELNMTRSEIYDKPGKPPAIASATINEDLRRRDFTVNAMGLSLNPGSRGLLLDPFNGVADIEAKVLRVLHNYAFLEEPVRLIRAIRLSSRFHWPLEERTQARYDAAKENNYIEYISDPAIGYEIEQLAYEDDPLNGVRVYDKEANDIRKQIPRRDLADAWRDLEDHAKELAKRLSGKEASTPSRTWKLLSSARQEMVLFLAVTSRQPAVAQKIKNFFTKWRQVQQKLPLPEMTELLITPQLPAYPKIAEDVFMLLLDGRLRSHTELMKFLKPLAPPPPPPPPPPRRGRGPKAAVAAPVAPAPPAGKGAKKGKAAPVVPAIAAKATEPAKGPQKGVSKPLPAVKVAPATKPLKPAHKAPPKKSPPSPKSSTAKKSSKKP